MEERWENKTFDLGGLRVDTYRGAARPPFRVLQISSGVRFTAVFRATGSSRPQFTVEIPLAASRIRRASAHRLRSRVGAAKPQAASRGAWRAATGETPPVVQHRARTRKEWGEAPAEPVFPAQGDTSGSTWPRGPNARETHVYYFRRSLSPSSVNPLRIRIWAANVGSSMYIASAGPRGWTSRG